MKLPRLFGLGREPSVPPLRWSGPPDATPIHAWLDAAGFPWRATRAELTARYGVTTDPAYDWEVIAVPIDPPLVGGLIGPLSAQTFGQVSATVPATRFSSATWFGDDARANLRRTVAELAPHLGGTKLVTESNVIRARWDFGPSSVTLTIWPRDLQGDYGGGSNPAHERYPRLNSACHINLQTGWRASLSEVERAAIAGLRHVDDVERLGVRTAEDIRGAPASESDLEYVRLLPEDGEGLIARLGVSADGALLVFCTWQLYVVPTADVVGMRLEKMSPGRGGGGEWLQLVCRDPADPEGTKTLQLASGSFNRGLEEFGAGLAAKLSWPYEIVDQGPDV